MIFGLLALRGGAINAEALTAMASALGLDTRSGLSGPAGLGPDPILADDGALALTLDGWVANRDELAHALGADRGLPDAELLLEAYGRWGRSCLERLVGEFAFAVWDARAGELSLACSAPIARPLCYHAAPAAFAFATRPRGLFALADLERHVDLLRISTFLGRVNTGRNRSYFEDVLRLLPGELLVAGPGGVRVEPWWQPDLQRELQLGSDDEYVEAFSDLFAHVVADHARDGTVGLSLSGGLDSGSLAAAAGGDGVRLHAYTAVPPLGFDGPVPPGRCADESAAVKALALMYPGHDVGFVTSSQGLVENLEPLFGAAEIPFRNAVNRGWIEAIYEQARADGVTTLLNGDHGNLTVSWNGTALLPKLLSQHGLRGAAREARALARAGHARSTARAILGQGVQPLLPCATVRAADRLRGRPVPPRVDPWSLLNPEFAAELHLERWAVRREPGLMSPSASYGREHRLRVLVSTGSFATDVHCGYRSMYGIDTRTPLADRRLVEFCLAVPEEQFERHGERRWLIRRAMEGRLPEATLRPRVRGLQAADWFERMSAERGALLEEVARFGDDALASQILHLPRLRQLLERWPRETPGDPHIAGLLRGGLGMALMTGRFLLWAQDDSRSEPRNRPPAIRTEETAHA